MADMGGWGDRRRPSGRVAPWDCRLSLTRRAADIWGDIWGLTLLDSAPLLLGSSHRGTSVGQDVNSVQCRQYGRGALHCVPALQVAIPVINRGIVGTARPALGP